MKCPYFLQEWSLTQAHRCVSGSEPAVAVEISKMIGAEKAEVVSLDYYIRTSSTHQIEWRGFMLMTPRFSGTFSNLKSHDAPKKRGISRMESTPHRTVSMLSSTAWPGSISSADILFLSAVVFWSDTVIPKATGACSNYLGASCFTICSPTASRQNYIQPGYPA